MIHRLRPMFSSQLFSWIPPNFRITATQNSGMENMKNAAPVAA